MPIHAFSTPAEVQSEIGERVRRLRLDRNLDQRDIAAKAGVSPRALRNLEGGNGSQLITLIRVLKALDALASLDAMAPTPTVSPMALLKRSALPQRASKQKGI